MKEYPIIMQPESVVAILAGSKTQTRRLVKPAPAVGHELYHADAGSITWYEVTPERPAGRGMTTPRQCHRSHHSPYGGPGDRLWVRERWNTLTAGGKTTVAYRADVADEGLKWKSSIFMPRWAARILLEVVSVRVERLQSITHGDALAEGCAGTNWVAASPYITGPHTNDGELPVEEYKKLWDKINRKRAPWASNPWVWVVEFRRLP